MSGSLIPGGGENVPGIPGACATRNFAYLVRGPSFYLWIDHVQRLESSLNEIMPESNYLVTEGLISTWLDTLWPRQNGRHFADDTFKRIFLNENVIISIKISLKFVPKGRINIIPALVQIMAGHRPGDKALYEPMMVGLLTHICVTRPHWVNDTWADELAHRGRATHICVGKRIIIGSENGLSPSRRQAIIWTNAGLLSIGPLRT